MDLTLTWDLFVIVFFAVVMTYSFIIGKHESAKIIIASYIAIVAVQGIGNLLARVSTTEPMFSMLGLTVDITLLSTTKLVLFVAAVVFLAVRGSFEIEFRREPGGTIDLVLTGIFGFATAGLLLSTLLTYVADVPILSKTIAETATIASIVQGSQLMATMIFYQDLWFAGPALLVLASGFIGREQG
ncbi:hypothetical protein AUJ46_04175 [Candidatus Peregrinibacteria bacterium CG1_02_54_53]|nr:MAG: hypothetical protein AUJ46_04175 [Candidatus Peregrinibacteria bacterium CG1_02_54_53]